MNRETARTSKGTWYVTEDNPFEPKRAGAIEFGIRFIQRLEEACKKAPNDPISCAKDSSLYLTD